MSNHLKCLIFDVDGTLANTEKDGHRVAFNRAFEDAGLGWHWSEELYGKLLTVSGGKERIRYYIEQYQADFESETDISELIPRLHQVKTKYYLQLLNGGVIQLRPGTKRLIQEAKGFGITLAIATTSSLPNVTALLEKHLDLDWFKVIAAGDIVPKKKPSPDIYHYVIDRLGFSPETMIVIEDSDNGLEAATAAGLTTIVTVNSYTEQQDFSNAALVISDLGEPNQPCRVIQGSLNAKYLDLASISSLI
ncbi:MAG: HAD family hydrolase [Cyanobacteria bacterium J06621_8]